MEIADVVGELADGMTVGIGGWGSRRKPMALVRAIARSSLRDLTVVSFGGPDVGLLVAAGKVARLVAGFVTLDSVAYDPWFSRVRQAGGLWVSEYDEGMLATALDAGAKRVPFLPLRAGMGSDVPVVNPQLRTVRSPYGDGEELLAVPAVELDVALVHLNRADARGNAQYLGPDPYFDDVLCRAAGKRFVSCERVVATSALASAGPVQSLVINRSMTDGVVEAPRGAHFTSCVPDYGRDEAFQAAYVRAGRDPERWAEFAARFLAGDEAEYQQAVDRFAAEVAV
jgi:acyl CoA:acetate/3-ketoacid CoA transferase alpha subunit